MDCSLWIRYKFQSTTKNPKWNWSYDSEVSLCTIKNASFIMLSNLVNWTIHIHTKKIDSINFKQKIITISYVLKFACSYNFSSKIIQLFDIWNSVMKNVINNRFLILLFIATCLLTQPVQKKIANGNSKEMFALFYFMHIYWG